MQFYRPVLPVCVRHDLWDTRIQQGYTPHKGIFAFGKVAKYLPQSILLCRPCSANGRGNAPLVSQHSVLSLSVISDGDPVVFVCTPDNRNTGLKGGLIFLCKLCRGSLSPRQHRLVHYQPVRVVGSLSQCVPC